MNGIPEENDKKSGKVLVEADNFEIGMVSASSVILPQVNLKRCPKYQIYTSLLALDR